jgi:leader peptidase (prepilin peptidase)/N-methyltransferase
MQAESFIYSLFGLIIGSFLNVCIYRIPLEKSVVFPGSSCPQCGKSIRFYDNIPVISYLLLRGKCRFCGKSISIQYPLVELLTGIAFYVCGRMWSFESPTFVNTLFLSIVIILIFTDYHHRILPNVLTLPGIIVGILLSPFQMPAYYSDVLSLKTASLPLFRNPQAALPWAGSILGAIIGGGILLVVGIGYEKLRKRQGLGMGDGHSHRHFPHAVPQNEHANQACFRRFSGYWRRLFSLLWPPFPSLVFEHTQIIFRSSAGFPIR